MDGSRKIDSQESSTGRDTFHQQSYKDYVDSGNDLEHVTTEDTRLVKNATSPLLESDCEEITDEGSFDLLDSTIRHTIGNLEPYMDGFHRGNAEVSKTSRLTFAMQSRNDSVHSVQDQKLDNLQEDLMCEEYRDSTLRPVDQLIFLPQDFLLSCGWINQVAPSTVVQLHQIVQQQSNHQQLLIPKLPTLPSTQLYYSMSMQTPPLFIKTESQKQLPQMGFVLQLMPSAEIGPEEMTDDEEIDEFVEKFRQKRSELGLTQEEVSSSIKELLGEMITYDNINLFENSNLRGKNMHSIKLVLQRWLQCIDTSNSLRSLQTPLPISCNTSKISDISRKFRKSADPVVKEPLEKEFVGNPKPAESYMDDFPRINEQVSKTSRVTFDWQSLDDSVHSAQDQKLGHAKQTSEPQKLEPLDSTQYRQLEQFAKNFKQWRYKFRISRADVAKGISKMAGHQIEGKQISKLWIRRFENNNMTTKLMRSFKSVLQLWLQNNYTSNNISRTSKPPKTYGCIAPEVKDLLLNLRNPFNEMARYSLEKTFLENPKPTVNEIATLAESFKVETHHVRIWFSRRREKKKRR